jgi:hypothetical protein
VVPLHSVALRRLLTPLARRSMNQATGVRPFDMCR